ncbi:MAG: hypothetical protein V3S40_14170 [Kiloniellales bacterium]
MRAVRLRLVAALVGLPGLALAADFEVGRRAANMHKCTAALREWRPLTETGAPRGPRGEHH